MLSLLLRAAPLGIADEQPAYCGVQTGRDAAVIVGESRIKPRVVTRRHADDDDVNDIDPDNELDDDEDENNDDHHHHHHMCG